MTELWWESNPPDAVQGIAEAKHARWIAEALYRLWRAKAKVVINHLIRDSKFDSQNPYGRNATGIYFYDGSKKAAYDAFSFPLVAAGKGSRRRVWGLAPSPGPVKIEGRWKGRWRLLRRVRAGAGGLVSVKLDLRSSRQLRARSSGATSYVWTL